jgi:hypothetical protein
MVAIDESALRQRSMNPLKELLGPTSLSHTVGHSAILSLDARVGDDVLVFGGPEDEVVVKKHIIVRAGSMFIRATHLVRMWRWSVMGGGRSPESLIDSIRHASSW